MNWYFLKKTTFSNSDHCIRYVHTYSTYTHAFKRYDKYVYDDNIHRHKVFKMVNKVFFTWGTQGAQTRDFLIDGRRSLIWGVQLGD